MGVLTFISVKFLTSIKFSLKAKLGPINVMFLMVNCNSIN